MGFACLCVSAFLIFLHRLFFSAGKYKRWILDANSMGGPTTLNELNRSLFGPVLNIIREGNVVGPELARFYSWSNHG